MKTIISVVLIVIIAFLAWALIQGIKEPIAFQEVKEARKAVVVSKLEKIRKAQEYYLDIKGVYAGNFDSLAYVLSNDSFTIEKIIGDPDDPSGEGFERIITRISAKDSMSKINFDLTDLPSIPFGEGKTFTIEADTLTYQSTLVNVCEVGTRWKDFMGEYASVKFSKYDNSYDPNKRMKFGNMNAPNLSGNWK
ncbi:hypothetical protein N9176_00380 [bacterium]|nr:hypothetical protein [bacterium]